MALRWTQQELKVALDRVGPTKRAKYGNKKHVADGITFDSKKEAARYQVLKLMAAAGKIDNLVVHVPWVLEVHNIRICSYIADFCYVDETRKLIVEDVKSPATRTAVYQIKKKLMEAIYNIRILET